MQNYFPTTALAGAAFQLAIWDIVTDNGDGFGTPTTVAGLASQSTDPAHPTDPDVLAAAVQYEILSLGQSSHYGIVYHNSSGGIAVQTLMGADVTDNGPSPIPEPAGIIPVFSGLAVIGLSHLRRGHRG